MKTQFLSFCVWLLFPLFALQAADPWLVIEGKEGIGKTQHIVFVTGEEYYRSEEGMCMFAQILARHHGFKCTVNAMLSLTGHESEIPDKTNVSFVKPYSPQPTGAISDEMWTAAKLTRDSW